MSATGPRMGAGPKPATIPCRLCGAAAALRFERTVLAKHRVGYYVCPACELTQTEEPWWLDEAYAEAISITDTGLLDRNIHARAIVATFLHLSGVHDQPCLDWAGGLGVFTRLMRDGGFQYFWQDPHAENRFARGFEWSDRQGTPAACTAFEVLEHLVRPNEDFAKLAAYGAPWILTSTEMAPEGGANENWFYLSAQTGQHVAFYRPATLQRLGKAHGYPVLHATRYFQAFAKHPFPAWRWNAAVRLGRVLYEFIRRQRPSYTVADCETLRSHIDKTK